MDLVISPSFVRMTQITNCTLLADELKESFSPNVLFEIKFEGELISDLTGREKIERLTILILGEGAGKILSVPKWRHKFSSFLDQISYSRMKCKRQN